MALSEQEQRLLEQLEASLAADDPTLARALRGDGPAPRLQRRHAGVMLLGLAVGLVGLIGGMQLHPVVSVLGFVVMLISAVSLSEQLRAVGEGKRRAPRAMPRSSRMPGSPLDDEHLDRARERWRQEGGR
ncbi:DUF3040 domain-containing protein [Luteococcus japonicus]|uniref:Putative membrane protein n=1 Tax=Luteococcus japonicus LSP_Lj1 TaxID=1255658 RepID=A0A1R4KMJ6_9ACTN|nr:DUF3040 domain-containing protein [Luteococcus japonicus]SJN45425.1 putative membrane protein [Luteococcus japonicus LSP_Lj1]